jgi:hypothetical protein
MKVQLVAILVASLVCLCNAQVAEDELCVACTELAEPFWAFFDNSTDTTALLEFIDQTCELLPTIIERNIVSSSSS